MTAKPRGVFAMGSHLADISAATVVPTPPQREELERFLQPAPAGTGRRSYTTKILIRKGWIKPLFALGNRGATLYQITSFGRAALARGGGQ